ncbi:MAG: electron transport complex subunit RsxC [Eubacteriales bacterium]
MKKHLKGIRVEHHKETKVRAIRLMPPPKKVYIPMVQHIGAPCEPQVAVGDWVKMGQVIGDSRAFISAPIHASGSGQVTNITKETTQHGQNITIIEITLDGKQEWADDLAPPVINCLEDFQRALRNSGLVGLGGAAFPTHVKYKTNELQSVDTLIVNGAECEPYITSDCREMLERGSSVLYGIDAIVKHLNLKKAYIGIEKNKPEIISYMKALTAGRSYIEVVPLREQYPQGAERVLVYETTGKHLLAGQLPASMGIIMSNVTTVIKLDWYLKTGKPLISRVLTVTGNAITKPQNVEAWIGTPLSEVVEFCGGYSKPPKKLILGGPMMGRAIPTDQFVVQKGNNALLAFDETMAGVAQETPCINCGRCVAGCPMNLMPTLLWKAFKRRDVERLNELNVLSCMECGCCSYVCPAKKQLGYINHLGKKLVMAKKQGGGK